VWLGLGPARLRAGRELAERLGETVATNGLREYYQPYTGAGMGAIDFGWPSLVMELLEPDPSAARSYLDATAAQPPTAR